MSSEPITLCDQRPLRLQLEGGGGLSLTYYCEETAPSESERLPPEKMRHTTLDDLKDLARKGFLQEFVEAYLIDDDVRWEFICRGKTIPDEQALAVFTIYNRQGKEGLKRLHRGIRLYERKNP